MTVNLSSSTLRVGTFNVRCDFAQDGEQRWEQRKDRLAAALRQWQPDVLGMQEPLRHQLDFIREALPAYDSVGVGRDDGQSAGEFCPVFFRRDRFELTSSGTFWFSDTPSVPGSKHWGNRIPRLCTWVCLTDLEAASAGDAAFRFYNLHLDHESQPARERSASLLLERISAAPEDAAIVAGDFNAEPANPAILALGAAGSPVPVSALSQCFPHPPGTFHGFTGQASGGPIDYLFVSPQWEVVDAEVLHGDGQTPYISDHFPLAATLRRKP